MHNPLYDDIEINLSNVPNSLISEENSEGFLRDALHSVKVDYLISSIVYRGNISKKGKFFNDGVIKDAVHSIPECVSILIVLRKCNKIAKIANRTDGNLDILKPDNQVPFNFRICCNFFVERTEISSSLGLDSKPSNEVIEDALNADRCAANETILVNTSHENEHLVKTLS